MTLLTAVVIVGVIIIAVALFYGNNKIEVSEYELVSCKVPLEFDGYRILQLSDLHSKNYGKGSRQIIDKVNKARPDIVVMTGDMVNCYDESFDVFFDLVEGLSSYRIYFVAGNNEIKMEDDRRRVLYEKLKAEGVTIIDNLKAEITRKNESINLYGMWFGLTYYKEIHSGYDKNTIYSKEHMEKDIGECNRDELNILLTHNPLYFKAYSEWGADIIMTGHVHGGIVRLPGRGGLLSPERKFFPKYSEGMYKLGESKMIVNRGLGGKPLLPRIFNKPEISVIILKQNQN